MGAICQVCAGENLSRLETAGAWLDYAQRQPGARHAVAERIAENPSLRFEYFLRCADCGFISISPLPTPQMLESFYRAYYANQKYQRKGERKIAKASRRIGRARKYARRGDFLDVGCNLGYAVEAARRKGFTATGIEIDSEAVKLATASFPYNTFHCTGAEAFAEAGQRFDLLYCSEVIEHVPDVKRFARALAQLCRPGGTLFLTTPDAGHPLRPRDFKTWNEVKPPEHLSWFTRGSLRRLLEDAGFRIARFGFTLKPGLRVVARKQ